MGEEKKTGKNEKNGRTGMFVLAGVICVASVAVLFAAINLYVGKQGNHTEQAGNPGAEETEGMTDVIGNVLADSEDSAGAEDNPQAGKTVSPADDAGMPYASVPILTWDEYYALGPSGQNDPNISGNGIIGTWSENELTMEEAGILGLREIYRVFGDDVDYSSMYLTMVLQNAEWRRHSQVDIWYGHMKNFVNEESLGSGEMRCYEFEVNAVTGEVYLLECSVDMRETAGQPELVGVDGLKSNAERYLEQLGLADPSELTAGIVRMDGESRDGSAVIYNRDDEPYLEILIWPYSGRLRGYRYYTQV